MKIDTNKRKGADLDKVNILEEELAKLSSALNQSNKRTKHLEEELISLRDTVSTLVAKSTDNHGVGSALSNKGEGILSDDSEEPEVDETCPWEIKFQQLREYRIIHGDCNVPQNFKENPQLGRWVKNQRQLYNNVKNGKKPGISPERTIKLDSIGFNWGKNFPPPPSWNEMFEKLEIFQQKMGNCNVPFNRTHPNALAKWTAYQRAEYKRFRKGLDSLLTLDQIEKLQEIGFNWKGPKL